MKFKTKKHLAILSFILLTALALINLPVSQAKNVELRFLAANHPYFNTIKPLIPEFEKQTGIKVNVENYEEKQLNTKLVVEFASNTSAVDVFMTRTFEEGRLFSRNKWYEPLNNYLKNKNKTSSKWDWADFSNSSKQAVNYKQATYGIPLVTEWEVVFYRKDVFKNANLAPPKTLKELEAAAAKLNNPSNGFYGIVSRGQRGAAVTQFSSYLYNHGGNFLKNGQCVVDSPEAIAAFKFYGKLLKNYGPPGVINMSWPQCQALFASGKVAMWTGPSSLIAGIIDPVNSTVSKQVGVATFPAGPAGNHPCMVTPWALAISSQSKHKDAAWKFVQWATSKEISVKAALIGSTMPRTSLWKDRKVQEKIHPDLAATFEKSGPIGTPYDKPVMTAVTEARDAIGDVILESIITGGDGDIEGKAKIAVQEVNKLLKKANEYKTE
jgi:multiple sugar transport system substrate-binding protein